MAITAQEVLQDAITILQDPSNTRWPLPELCKALNAGLREMATLQPRATAKTETLTLVEGTKQSLPSGVLLILRAIQNASGATISPVDREELDMFIPGWHQTAVVPFNDVVQHVVFDLSDPETYWVYPGNTGSGSIICQVSKMPTLVAVGSGDDESLLASYDIALDVADQYFNALVDYVLHKAFSKDIQMAGNAARAAAHYGKFTQALGVRRASEQADNVNTTGEAPA